MPQCKNNTPVKRLTLVARLPPFILNRMPVGIMG